MNIRERIIKNLENCFVPYKQVQNAFNEIDRLRMQQKYAKSKGQNNCMFVGPSGVGKTEIINAYCNRPENAPYEIVSKNAKVTAMPVLSVDVPSPYSPTRFYKEILKNIGPYFPSKADRNNDRSRVIDMINTIKLETLFLDEAHSILYSRGINVVEGMEVLKDLSNNIDATIIVFGVPGMKKLVELDFQYYRRFPVIELQPFKQVDEEFISVLKSIEVQIDAPFPLGFSNKNSNRPEMLFKMSKGLFSQLMKVVKVILAEAGLYNTNIELSEIRVTAETLFQARLKMLQQMDEEKQSQMLQRMNETSESMMDSKLKLSNATKSNKRR